MKITSDTLLDMLRDAGRPVTRRELSENLGLSHTESDQQIKPLLLELIREGHVVRNRRAAYGLTENMDLLRGRVSAHADGLPP